MNWLDRISVIWIWIGNLLVISMGFYPFILHLFGAHIKKNASKLRRSNRLRHFLGVQGKSHDIFLKPDAAMNVLKIVISIVVLTCFVMALDNTVPLYLSSVINQKANLVSIIVGLTGISMTVSAILATFDKKYYLCFSIRDVLSVSGYNWHLFLSGISCIFFLLVAFLTPETLEDGEWGSLLKYVVFVFGLVNVLSVARTMQLVYEIVFSGKRIELKLLEQLHRLFDFRSFDISNMKEKQYWDRLGTLVCVEHLAEKYINCCTSFELGNIKQFEYVTTSELYRERWSKKARGYSLLISFIWITFSLSVAYSYLSCTLEQLVFLGIVYILTAIVILLSDNEWMQRALIDLYLGEWGYHVVEIDGSEHYCSLGLFTLKDKYQKLVDKTNDIVALFYIQKEVGVSRDIMLKGFHTLCRLMKFQDINDIVFYLPAFSVGYFLYIKDESNQDLLQIKKIYKELVTIEREALFFSRMMYSQIYSLIKYKYDDANELNDCFVEYICWLRDE